MQGGTNVDLGYIGSVSSFVFPDNINKSVDVAMAVMQTSFEMVVEAFKVVC